MDITKIDKNFIVETKIEREGLHFYDAEQEPFQIYGIFREGDRFRRMPETIARTVNEGVGVLHTNTAGGRLRFKTNSKFIAINTQMCDIYRGPHFALSGCAGFDLYEKTGGTQQYIGTFMPPYDLKDGYESIIDLPTAELREITINFPLYSGIKKLYVGLDENATLLPADEYKITKPVVYYGSSITQGGCASKPGSSYQSILSSHLDCDYINLGFSGSARGESEIVDYINTLDMSIFVLDYDHNAPTLEHLKNTHERFFKQIREKHPSLPIIIMSRPQFNLSCDDLERLNIIRTTYENAIKSGDKNVYILDGKQLMALVGRNGTVDNCHPTDSGFLSMANAIEPIMRQILGI